ncbi:MAG: hypothetical protein WCI49_11640 [Ferruginibacter sp.]
MKLFKIIISGLAVVSLASVYTSCKRELPGVAQITTDLSNAASVQVFSATVKAQRNYVYVDGAPVSGTALAYGGVFPGTAYSFWVTPGSRSVTVKDTAVVTTQIPLTFSQAFDAGKSYTVFTYDTITSVKQLTVLNTIVVPKDTSSRLRFANFLYNSTPVTSVDVYSYRSIPGTPIYKSTTAYNNAAVFAPVFTSSTPVFTGIATNQVTAFIPYPSGLTDTLYVFAAGTTAPLLSKGAVQSLTPTRSYTSVYNGSYNGTLAARLVTTFATY